METEIKSISFLESCKVKDGEPTSFMQCEPQPQGKLYPIKVTQEIIERTKQEAYKEVFDYINNIEEKLREYLRKCDNKQFEDQLTHTLHYLKEIKDKFLKDSKGDDEK